MGKSLFITGTGTDVGKTYVTALIVKKLRDSGRNAGYYKAAISGAERDGQGNLLPGDALYVNETARIGEQTSRLVSYVYPEAVSPHLAAKINSLPIDFQKVARDFQSARERYDYLTMEGSGGIVCPLRWDDQEHLGLDDLVHKLGLSVLVVAHAGLGTINSTVLTIEHLRMREIPVKGILLNHFHPGDLMEEDNRRMVTEMTGVPVLAVIQENAAELEMDAGVLASLYE
ncbi:MAG: dethiobiotin synthase [Verrucomicrobia bacterium]|nr:dethiobiotin synthase [Verrucomicrobiota bacterium]